MRLGQTDIQRGKYVLWPLPHTKHKNIFQINCTVNMKIKTKLLKLEKYFYDLKLGKDFLYRTGHEMC